MTLAQNANVQKALTAFTFAARTPAASKRDEDMYLVAETRALIDAIRLALLAEWSAGEEMEEAHKAGVRCLATNDCKCTVMGGVPMPCHYHSVRATQFLEAAAPLIRAPLVAEVETLRGEWDEAVADLRRSLADTERVANDWKAEAKDRQREVVRQVEAKVTAEARVQRLEAALKKYDASENEPNDGTFDEYNNAEVAALDAFVAEARAALLPEETTNE